MKITWFSDNQLKLNPDKCHLLLTTKEQITLKNLHIKNSLREKLFGINFDYKLNLQNAYWRHLPKSIKKVKWTCKIGTIYDMIKKRILMNAFFKSQFRYCPLIWMWCNRSLNNKTKRLHKQCLRIVCSDNKSISEELLERDGSASAHHQNIK